MEKLFNWLSIVFGVIGGFLATALGGADKWLVALLVFVIIDYATGVIKAIVNKTLSSKIGGIGILKKVMIFAVVYVAVVLQRLTNNALPLRDIVVMFYVCNEGISLLENIAMFIPLPAKLKEVLLQLRDKENIEEAEQHE